MSDTKYSPEDPPAYSPPTHTRPDDSKAPIPRPGEDYIHKGENMEVNLGPMWGLAVPAYGLGGHVKGTVKLLEKESNVQSIEAKVLQVDLIAHLQLADRTAQLQGNITIRTNTLGELTGEEPIRFLQLTQPLHPHEGYRFSFELPTHINIKGQEAPLPSSFTTTFYFTTCTILYMLKFEMVRKGLRRHESRVFLFVR